MARRQRVAKLLRSARRLGLAPRPLDGLRARGRLVGRSVVFDVVVIDLLDASLPLRLRLRRGLALVLGLDFDQDAVVVVGFVARPLPIRLRRRHEGDGRRWWRGGRRGGGSRRGGRGGLAEDLNGEQSCGGLERGVLNARRLGTGAHFCGEAALLDGDLELFTDASHESIESGHIASRAPVDGWQRRHSDWRLQQVLTGPSDAP